MSLVLACGSGSPEPPRHLVIVSIDTLRADFLPIYGHPWVEASVLDRLAAEGAVFERHAAAAPTTLSSHTSLMTGQWPHTHGVPRNGFVVPRENRMLAEILRDADFETAAFVGGYPLAQRFGFGQGFEHFSARFDPGTQLLPDGVSRAGESLTDDALAWLSAREDRTRRLFLFVHYFDVHGPFVQPEPWNRMYRKDRLNVLGTLRDVREVRTMIRRDAELAPAASEALAAQYAAGITYVDHQLGRLVGAMRTSGLLEETLFVVTSDHGETMAEHPGVETWDHGKSVFETAMRIPLVVRRPGAAGGGMRVPELTSNVDVLPSVLELLGVATPDGIEGVSFAQRLRAESFDAHDVVFSEATKPARPELERDGVWINAHTEKAAQGERYKLVLRPSTGERLLFDLEQDPGEENDLLARGDEVARAAADRLAERLSGWSEGASGSVRRDPSPDARERLESLGYVEGAAP